MRNIKTRRYTKTRTDSKLEDINLYTLASVISDEDAARMLLESILWPDGIPVCPKCKNKGAYKITPHKQSKRPTRQGLWKCKSCRRQFTVTVGTIFERSHIQLSKWMLAYYLFCSSKKSISAHELHRSLGVSKETAWFMLHRIRHTFVSTSSKKLTGTIEVDEVYIGGKPRGKNIVKGQPIDAEMRIGGKPRFRNRRWKKTKTGVVVLVQRSGEARAEVLSQVTSKKLKDFIRKHVHPSAKIYTDGSNFYDGIGEEFEGGHETVIHSEREYVRGDVHTNTVEAYNGVFKRAFNGTWHKLSKRHLHRYIIEFVFRWNTMKLPDNERMEKALTLCKGKRLLYDSAISKTGT